MDKAIFNFKLNIVQTSNTSDVAKPLKNNFYTTITEQLWKMEQLG